MPQMTQNLPVFDELSGSGLRCASDYWAPSLLNRDLNLPVTVTATVTVTMTQAIWNLHCRHHLHQQIEVLSLFLIIPFLHILYTSFDII
jgi:hypothetical protein